MAILKIARMGHPILSQRAEEVRDPTGFDTAVLVNNMIDTLADSGGIGLAAPQVHESKRIVIFFVPEGRAQENDADDDDGPQELTVMVNPAIEPLSEDKEVGWEACLSVPGLMGAVPRYTSIRYSWTGLDGKPHSREAQGFHARVVQHECDHLDGILYPMRMEDMSLFGFTEETNQNRELLAQARPDEEFPSEYDDEDEDEQ
jgi:peptide deformylase